MELAEMEKLVEMRMCVNAMGAKRKFGILSGELGKTGLSRINRSLPGEEDEGICSRRNGLFQVRIDKSWDSY